MTHLVRVGLLVVLFANAILLARMASTVVSIEWIGIRHVDNAAEWASRAVANQDPEACVDCHEPINDSWEIGDHLRVTCENCHGATKDHVEQAREGHDAPFAISDARDLCLFCHGELDARPADFPQVEAATHGSPWEGETALCTSCHNPHHPGIPPVIPHEVEPRPDCLLCHAKTEWVPVSDAHEGMTNQDCLTCHRPEVGSQ